MPTTSTTCENAKSTVSLQTDIHVQDSHQSSYKNAKTANTASILVPFNRTQYLRHTNSDTVMCESGWEKRERVRTTERGRKR